MECTPSATAPQETIRGSRSELRQLQEQQLDSGLEQLKLVCNFLVSPFRYQELFKALGSADLLLNTVLHQIHSKGRLRHLD